MRAVIIGCDGGIGSALQSATAARFGAANVAGFNRSGLDLEDEDSIAGAADKVRKASGALDLVIVATGFLHGKNLHGKNLQGKNSEGQNSEGDKTESNIMPEKSLRDFDAVKAAKAFAVNATGPLLVAKHFLPLLSRSRRSVFAVLSARVGSISDNRLGGWYSYRASKAALNMGLKSAAIETARRNKNAVIVGLHPGTTDTKLSAPFQSGVPAGKLFTPAFVAGGLLDVIEGLTPADSGCVFDWAGKQIAP